MRDIVKDGWKADNRYKCGFQRELEKGMRKLLVGTDIVANPHINSKIHVWKKEYGTLFDLLSKSGIGWNSTTNSLDIQDEVVWEIQKKVTLYLSPFSTTKKKKKEELIKFNLLFIVLLG